MRAVALRRAAAVVLVLAAFVAGPMSPGRAETAISITVSVIDSFDPRDPQRRQFGALEFRGGLQLSSSERNFGGLSAIRVRPDGAHFIAVTDKAYWLRGRIVYHDGAPAGIADAAMAPMLGADGKPLADRGWYDTEALAEDGGALYVGIERVHQIVRFDFARNGFAARGTPLPVPAAFAKLPANRGVECLLAAPKAGPLGGALIAVSERGLDAAGNVRGFLIGGKMPGEFTVKRKNDFDIVDCALTPEGELLLLERFFTWRSGVAMRIRRVALASVRPGALLDGPALIEADLGYQIDNMEGLSVHRATNGETILTLVSDDNFSLIQRTLLLQFALIDR